jgi:hypothetical protein
MTTRTVFAKIAQRLARVLKFERLVSFIEFGGSRQGLWSVELVEYEF